MAELNGKQRRFLRGLGHHLSPVVQIGHDGVTGALVKQTREQLEAHELIKVKVSENAPEDRHASFAALAEQSGAQLAQVLGRTALLYKRRKEKPALVLPKA